MTDILHTRTTTGTSSIGATLLALAIGLTGGCEMGSEPEDSPEEVTSISGPGDWQYVGTGAAASSAGTSALVSTHASTAIGDLLVMACAGRANVHDWSAPGYTQRYRGDNSGQPGTGASPAGLRTEVFTRTASVAGAARVSVTSTSGLNGWSCRISTFRGGAEAGGGAGNGAFFLGACSSDDCGPRNATMRTGTGTAAVGALIVRLYASMDDNNHGAPANSLAHATALLYEHDAVIGVQHAVSMAYEIQPTGDATGSGTMQQRLNAVDSWSSVVLVFAPAMAPQGDAAAPAAVKNLVAPSSTATTVSLTWTAPGDDGSTGTATSYDLRYRVGTTFGEADWASATRVTGEPTPKASGGAETMTVTGLSSSTTYAFAIKTSDEVPNLAAISSPSPARATAASADATAPAAVTNLAAPSSTPTTINLTWTAPGDDGATGTATSYDVRYRVGTTFTETDWATATQVIGEPTPQAAGTSAAMTITGLSASTTYAFAIKASDETPNVAAISSPNPTRATTASADAIAPVAVTNLATSNATVSSIRVSWTAPGNDGTNGTAASYDLRYSTVAITASNFGAAMQVMGEPAPAQGGTAQTMLVNGLAANTKYYFALTAVDEVPNVSGISNVPSATTLATSSSKNVSGIVIPPAFAGYSRVAFTEFPNETQLGTGLHPDTAQYLQPRPNAAQDCTYKDSSQRGVYCTRRTTYETGGKLRQWLHTENAGQATISHVPTGNINYVSGLKWTLPNQDDFMVSLVARFDDVPGRKMAYLRWCGPRIGTTGYCEDNIPEARLDGGTCKGNAFHHHESRSTQDAVSMCIDMNDWHLYQMHVNPGKFVDFYLDGKLIAHNTSFVSTSSSYWVGQSETFLAGQAIPFPHAEGWIEWDAFAVDIR